MAGGTWLGVSRSGRFATVTNNSSAWDHALDVVIEKGWVEATALASKATAVAAAATAAAAVALLRHAGGGGGERGDGGSSRVEWVEAAVAASLKWFDSSPKSSSSVLCALCAAAGLAAAASVGLAAVAAATKARKSRGGLVADFLKGEEDAATYCMRLSKARGLGGGGRGQVFA